MDRENENNGNSDLRAQVGSQMASVVAAIRAIQKSIRREEALLKIIEKFKPWDAWRIMLSNHSKTQ